MKIDYSDLLNDRQNDKLNTWLDTLPERLAAEFSTKKHGRLKEWEATLLALPTTTANHIELDTDTVQIGRYSEIQPASQQALEQSLRQLHPWRKGPYDIFGITIDTEWRSDWKWQRLHHSIQPLKGRLILDVGCGSGYHCWRMLGAGATRVIGIEPTMLYVMQFQALKHFTPGLPIDVLPLSLEDMPLQLNAFDTVFSMGVMYHRKSPIDHLIQLHDCLKRGGELILETLIIDGEDGNMLMPEGRYAKMRNVWFIPDVPMLTVWLQRAGFRDIKLVSKDRTSIQEQRSTDWMQFESLKDFLDPSDPLKTAEGYPAPLRAVLTATAV